MDGTKTIVRVRVPGTGEHIDDGTDEWDGTPLSGMSLSAGDLGCEPGTPFTLELIDESGRVLQTHDVVAG